MISLVNEARQAGKQIVSDQYPYDGAATATLEEIIVVPRDLSRGKDFDIESALADEALRRRTGLHGFQHVAQHHSFAANAGKYMSLFEQIGVPVAP